MTTATKERTAVTIGRDELQSILTRMSKVTAGRHVKPILGNVLIGNGLVTATNLEIKIDLQIEHHCDPMLVPADRLLAIARSCRGTNTITLDSIGNAVTVKAGRNKWTLPTEDVSEFPTWEPDGLKPVCRMPADQFVRAVHAVSYAVDLKSSRYALGAVLIDVEQTPTGSNPTFVATDGRRLSAAQTENDQAVDNQTVLVPVNAIDIAAEQAEGKESSVQIEATSREVVITCDGATVTALLVNGQFPRWRDVFPEKGGCDPAMVERDELLSATTQAAVVVSEQSKGVNFAFANDTLTLSAKSSEYGESKVKCPVETSGGCVPVTLNPKFVSDYLNGLPGDEEPTVQIVTHGPGGATVMKVGDYRCVIMPLANE